MKFELCTAARILFERDGIDRVGELAAGLGRRAAVLRGGDHLDRSGAVHRLAASCAEHGVSMIQERISGEPTVEQVDEATARARAAGCDLVIGIGGGSALDAAKAVAGLLTNPGSALDYLEVVGSGKPIAHPAAPVIAIPTTAGTGTEVTRNAVLTCVEQGVKASLRSPYLLPRVALVDPALTHSVPPGVTASTGLDALTQLIEPYVSVRAQPLTDALALAGIRAVARSLRRAVLDGTDVQARDDMAVASLMGGLCLANSGLGAVHGLAAPLGATVSVPHGVACAVLLPHVMAANVAALRARAPDGPELRRFADVSVALRDQPATHLASAIDAGVARVAELVRSVGIESLGKFGLKEEHITEVARRAQRASSMKANPVSLSEAVLSDCLRRAL